MPIITFWTELNKEIGQTAAAIAAATQMAMEHNKRILLMSTYNNQELQDAFWPPSAGNKKLISSLLGNQKKVMIDNGISGMAKALASNRLNPEQIPNYTKTVFKGRLEILSGFNGEEKEYEELKPIYPDVIQRANRFYDVVIIDLNKTMSDFANSILDISDIVAYGINQKNKSIEHYMESKESGFISTRNDVIPYIARYDQYSKYSTKNIGRLIREKRKINVMPYNTLFAEACDEGTVADYFLKVGTIKGEDRNVKFLGDIRSLTDAIIYRLQELQMKI